MLLFTDSFSHVSDIIQKWTLEPNGPHAHIDLTGTRSRSGLGACVTTNPGTTPFGDAVERNFATSQTGLVIGDAYNSPVMSGEIFGVVSGFGVGRVAQVRLVVNMDGSITIRTGNEPTSVAFGTTEPNVIAPGSYVYIELKIAGFTAASLVTLRVNGQTVFADTGNTNPAGSGSVDTVYLGGPASLSAAHGDFYVLNFTNASAANPNIDFLGPIEVLAFTPVGDGPTVQWVPSAGTDHFALINAIPPNNGATNVSSAVLNDIDKYLFPVTVGGFISPIIIDGVTFLVTGIAPNQAVNLVGVQLNYLSTIAAVGTGSISPVVGSTALPSLAVIPGGGAFKVQSAPLDVNPLTGLRWTFADFISTPIGQQNSLFGQSIRVTQVVVEVISQVVFMPAPPPTPGSSSNIGIAGRPLNLIRKGKGQCPEHITHYDRCLELEAIRLRLIKFPRVCTIPEDYLSDTPWDDERGAIPAQSVPFFRSKGITTPTPDSGDNTVLQLRVPTGYDGLLTGFYFQYSGPKGPNGFGQGSGDILWRIRRNQWFVKDLSNVPFLLGDPENPVPMTQGQILQDGQVLSVLVNVPNLTGNIEVGNSTVYAGLMGFFWPRG